jgi:hypothetical protein
MKDSADPFEGWALEEILKKALPAKNDIHGCLFFYLQDILRQFCQRISSLKLSIQLVHVNAKDLPRHLQLRQYLFDRIEVWFPSNSHLGRRWTVTFQCSEEKTA